MPVPSIILARRTLCKFGRAATVAVSLTFVTNTALSKGPAPAVHIPLQPLGFELPQTQFLLAGGTMMTLDYVDDKHLLLTYTSRRLMKRLPDDPPRDQDRNIDAVLVELPDGKPIARTSWRMHDRGQYLWPLGHGRFLLRIRNTLTTVAPMVNYAKGDAFREHPFIETKREVGGVLLSPDADLLILETTDPPAPAGLEEAAGASSNETAKRPSENGVQINFYFLTQDGGTDEVRPTPDLVTHSRNHGRIPANSAGYLTTVDQGKQHWAFDFNAYSGKKLELAAFDSTCRPSPVLVSPGEFVAFGCRLSHVPQIIGGFNMRGEQMWEQTLPETYLAPTFSYAPGAGRFAMSRMLTHTSLITEDAISPELVAGQSIIVYQTESGRQLLHVEATPVARAGQNFSLSPDGLSFAVVRTDAIDIYTLPPPTDKEREAMKLAVAAAPQQDGTHSVDAAQDGSASTSAQPQH